MVIYVRLEPHETRELRKNFFEVKNKFEQIQSKAEAFDKLRKDKKRNSIGLITKVKELKEEITKIKIMLPKVETITLKERPVKALTRPQLKPSERKKYEEELEEIRKKIMALKS